MASGPAQLERDALSRRISLHANIPEGVALGAAADRLDQIVAEVGLPAAIAASTSRMKDSVDSVQRIGSRVRACCVRSARSSPSLDSSSCDA